MQIAGKAKTVADELESSLSEALQNRVNGVFCVLGPPGSSRGVTIESCVRNLQPSWTEKVDTPAPRESVSILKKRRVSMSSPPAKPVGVQKGGGGAVASSSSPSAFVSPPPPKALGRSPGLLAARSSAFVSPPPKAIGRSPGARPISKTPPPSFKTRVLKTVHLPAFATDDATLFRMLVDQLGEHNQTKADDNSERLRWLEEWLSW